MRADDARRPRPLHGEFARRAESAGCGAKFPAGATAMLKPSEVELAVDLAGGFGLKN